MLSFQKLHLPSLITLAKVVTVVFLSIPTSRNDAKVNAQQGSDITITPQGYNCEPLNDLFQVRWKVLPEEDLLAVELVGAIDDTEYLSFGPSGSDTKTVMVGSDVVVADMYQDQVRVKDYFMNFKAECVVGYAAGVCPDTDLSSAQNDVSDISGERDPISGVTVIRYKRPMSASDDAIPSKDQDELPIPVDRPILGAPGNVSYVTWAIGPIETDTGMPKLHTAYPKEDVALEFGRMTLDNCPPITFPPTLRPSAPDNGDTSEDDTNIVDCRPGNFQETIQIVDELTMSYLVLEDTLTVRMVYSGNAWVSFATSENPSGSMIGAEAVIGLTGNDDGSNNGNVAKWYLYSREVPGVVRMEETKQTLTNTSMVQEGDITTLTFTKRLSEPSSSNELTINGTGGENTFLWAYGNTNELGSSHKKRGVFRLTLNQCREQATAKGTSILLVDNDAKSLFAAHGILAAIAWGILVPLALASSLLRKFIISWFPNNKKTWFNLHMALNVLAFVATLLSFILAISATSKSAPEGEDINHFDGTHQTIGLTIMILVFIQILFGLVRPHPHPHPPPPSDDKNEEEELDSTLKYVGDIVQNGKDEESEERGEVEATIATATNKQTLQSNTGDDKTSNKQPRKTVARRLWELFHKFLGVSLLAVSWYQVQDGFNLFSYLYPDEKDYTFAFWIVVLCIGGMIFIAWGKLVVDYVKKLIEENDEDED